MNALDLAKQFVADGAVLHWNGTSIVLVPGSVIEGRGAGGWRLVYHDLNVSDQHGTHALEGPSLVAAHAFGIHLRCADGQVAYLCPAAEDSDEAAAAISAWKADIASGRLDADFFTRSISDRIPGD